MQEKKTKVRFDPPPSWKKSGVMTGLLKDWFPQRHEDEFRIESAPNKKARLDAIHDAIHKRGLAWSLAQALERDNQFSKDDTVNYRSDFGNGHALTAEDKPILAADVARFIGKYGEELVKAKNENHSFGWLQPQVDKLENPQTKETEYVHHARQFDYSNFLHNEMNNPEVVSEIMKNPVLFGQMRLAGYGHDYDNVPADRTINDHDKRDLKGLEHPAVAAASGLQHVDQKLAMSMEPSKEVMNIIRKHKDDISVEGVLPALKKLSGFIHPDNVPPSLHDAYLGLQADNYLSNKELISNPKMIQKMADVLHNAPPSKYGDDSPDTRISSFFNKNINTTPEQWLEYQHRYNGSNIEAGKMHYPRIPPRFIDDPSALSKIVNGWDWEKWSFGDWNDTYKKSSESIFYKLRDIDPKLLKQVSEKIKQLPPTKVNYDNSMSVPNDGLAEFADSFDENGDYIKTPITSVYRQVTRLTGSDPNHKKVDEFVKHAIGNVYENQGQNEAIVNMAELGQDRSLARKLSPETSRMMYGLTHHVKNQFPENESAQRLDLKRSFANTMVSSPEYKNVYEAGKFWNDYEREVRQVHFPVAEAAMTGEHKQHVPFRKRRYEKGMINENGEEVFSSQGSEHLWPALKGHAKLSQAAILQRYLNDNNADPQGNSVDAHHPSHSPKFKSINGKLHVKVYRGIAGDHADDVMNHWNEGKDFDAAGVQSFSLSPHTAAWFALTRQSDVNEEFVKTHHGMYLDAFKNKFFPHLTNDFTWKSKIPPLKGKPRVLEGWMPLEDAVHFGAVSRDYDKVLGTRDEHTVFNPQHAGEQEIVFHVKGNKIPHNHFRIHEAHKFVKKQKLRGEVQGLEGEHLGRESNMPVVKTTFDDLIHLSHGHSADRVPPKLREAAQIPNPEHTGDKWSSAPKTIPKPGVIQHKGIPIEPSEPEAKTPETPRDPLRSRHTLKKSIGDRVRIKLSKAEHDPAQPTEKPKMLFHETLADHHGSISSDWLKPTHGQIVQEAYGEYLNPNEYGEDISRPAVFFSADPKELGGYIRWNVSNKLNKPREDVTWDDVKNHGMLVMHNPKKSSYSAPIYHAKDPSMEHFTDLEGNPVSSFDDDDSNEVRSAPASVESNDYFSLGSVEPHHFLVGDELVNYLKSNAKNIHTDQMNNLAAAGVKNDGQ